MIELLLVSAATGAAGGLHCAAMCGGIAGMQGARPVEVVARGAAVDSPLARRLAFNAGRIASYTLAGALAGSASGAAIAMSGSLPLRNALFVLANLMLIAAGLQVAGWNLLARVERVGAPVWRALQPAAAREARKAMVSAPHSLSLGALWGLMPCGLVYAMLAGALARGSALEGALSLLAFGLGTLPNLLFIGWLGKRALGAMRHPGVRLAAGAALALYGITGLLHRPALAAFDALCTVLPA